MTQPRIYVACLAAYNNGHLHGAWLDAAKDEWTLWEGVRRVLATSPVEGAEEWAIHDYEGFAGAKVHEYTSINTVARLAAFVVEHGRLGAEALAHYGDNIEEAEEALRDRYLGEYASLADYMEELNEEGAGAPEHLRRYIDWEGMGRDAELGGDVLTFQTCYNAVHVFAGG